jgi:hypothetical protein
MRPIPSSISGAIGITAAALMKLLHNPFQSRAWVTNGTSTGAGGSHWKKSSITGLCPHHAHLLARIDYLDTGNT